MSIQRPAAVPAEPSATGATWLPATRAESSATGTLWRCGGRDCGTGECEHEEELHRAASGTGPMLAPPIVHDVLSSGGAPLPSAVRKDLEVQLGHSFADVRIHADEQAARSARSVQAHAYTVGRHIAFAAGRYDPGSEQGRQLLAHELSHASHYPASSALPTGALRVSSPDEPEEVCAEQIGRYASAGSGGSAVAQHGGATGAPTRTPSGAATVWRRWDAPAAGECTLEEGRALTKVVVDQEKAQSVTLHWNDGSVESGMCSTGKGHCCTDTSDGVAASVTESRRNGSNCTPITAGAGYPITDRYRSYNGWRFWSTFVPARGIGLHQHHTVTGTPLSHGCVRLHEETAQKIFCGAQQNRTRVEVRGFARPDCDEPELQAEWRKDFESAGAQVSDGESPAIRDIIRQNRQESRRILRESYGRELTDAEIAAGSTGSLAIPRCRSRGANPTTEERRAVPETGGATWLPSTSSQLLASSGLERLLPTLSGALASAGSLARARTVAQTQGRALWAAATGRTAGLTPGDDDRPLYWARLAMTRIIRQWEPSFRLSDADRTGIITAFEDASRGTTDISFGPPSATKRILISGFDPFGFESATYGGTAAANPSAAAALALDATTLHHGSVDARVESVVFPVRFADFDAGLIERVIRPYLSGSQAVNMLMTISMGAPGDDFEVEEHAGRRRSGGFPDNADDTSVGEPSGLASGPEFLRTSLPSSARRQLGRTAPNVPERRITEIRPGETTARTSDTGPSPGSRSVQGSGGGYLSNEIFYRVALMRRTDGSSVPVGHLHTPFLTPSTNGLADPAFVALRRSIVDRVRSILEATLPDL